MTLGLVMIVRDEAPIIERCLASVAPLLDHWTIVDTGSTDKTRKRVKRALADVPGRLVDHTWVDFGTNLTEAMREAKGTADWLLRLDADMTVQVQEGWDLKAWLDSGATGKGYAVELTDHGTSWRLPLLVSGRAKRWRYVGPCHEYLDQRGHVFAPLVGLTITHHADGHSRPVKWERDIELLRGALADNPNDSRSLYYLAESLRGSGQTDLAIDAFERRAAMEGTWEPERWHAQYRAAALSADPAKLVAAYQARPTRAEPLAELCRLLQPPLDDLFVEPNVYGR